MSKRFAPGVNRMPSCPRGSKTTPLQMGGDSGLQATFNLSILCKIRVRMPFPENPSCTAGRTFARGCGSRGIGEKKGALESAPAYPI
jgi:hypothetical protein